MKSLSAEDEKEKPEGERQKPYQVESERENGDGQAIQSEPSDSVHTKIGVSVSTWLYSSSVFEAQ